MERNEKIGLFGFGCVGQAVYAALEQQAAPGLRVKRIGVRDREKVRSAPAERFSYEPGAILDDPEISLVVELIDDAEAAFALVAAALARGKAVVTANKKMVAHRLPELIRLQRGLGVPLLYEAAVGGSIPIIRTLETMYGREPLTGLHGIVNGSSNYILSRLAEPGGEYRQALATAQQLGFAEADQRSDVGGFDSKYKLGILAAHAFGLNVAPDQILNLGIEHLGAADRHFARQRQSRIKLVARAVRHGAKQVALFVLPQLVKPGEALFPVDDEWNGISFTGSWGDQQFLQGRGAGGFPTASAVLADIHAVDRGYRYAYAKAEGAQAELALDGELEVYIGYQERLQLDGIRWTEVTEDQPAKGYRVGRIALGHLLELQEELQHRQLPVIATGAPVQWAGQHAHTDHEVLLSA
ncbi:MAG: homoserine dehydrogenase [Bacteroidota bacterium]